MRINSNFFFFSFLFISFLLLTNCIIFSCLIMDIQCPKSLIKLRYTLNGQSKTVNLIRITHFWSNQKIIECYNKIEITFSFQPLSQNFIALLSFSHLISQLQFCDLFTSTFNYFWPTKLLSNQFASFFSLQSFTFPANWLFNRRRRKGKKIYPEFHAKWQ